VTTKNGIIAMTIACISLLEMPSIARDVVRAPATLTITGGRIAVPDANNGVLVFRGIPYAAPPTGARRWQPPADVASWRGVWPAATFGPDCMQAETPDSPATRPKSENCLVLNVWTPGLRAPGTRPVFVWIHGGGSRVGSGAEPQFDGSAFARAGIVVVTINYRLGPFGFLSTPALSAASGHGASGNYGFMDQIAALRWVQGNIARFGGDPHRVTIGGESSGSVSVSTLMASPSARGLFAQAIGESGSAFRVAEFGSMGATGLAAEEAKGLRLAAALGGDVPDHLRSVPATAVLDAAERLKVFYNLPVVDGWILPTAPWRVFAAHRQADVPLLVGWNAQEGSLQLVAPHGSLDELLSRLYRHHAAELAPFYTQLATPADAYVMAAGDNGIAYPTWLWAQAQTSFGHAPVYLYMFDHAPSLRPGAFGPVFDVHLAGAFHSAEIPYVFGTLGARADWMITPQDRQVAGIVHAYWANFIRHGDPNGRRLPKWSRYMPGRGAVRLHLGAKAVAEPDPDLARLTALRGVHDAIDPPLPTAPATAALAAPN